MQSTRLHEYNGYACEIVVLNIAAKSWADVEAPGTFRIRLMRSSEICTPLSE
jgi:hypothetical protein